MPVTPPTFEDALNKLKSNETKEFLSLLATKEADYTSLGEALRKITFWVESIFAERPDDATKLANFAYWKRRVTVIPRGSFASRTALADTADLDLDLLFPADYPMKDVIDESNEMKLDIKYVLGMDYDCETIQFQGLRNVLNHVWDLLSDRDKGLKDALQQCPATKTNPALMTPPLTLRDRTGRDAEGLWRFTRSIPAKTTTPHGSVEVDLFIKVATTVRNQEMIVGLDKNGPDGQTVVHTTQFIPTPGQWIGDRVLGTVDRSALLMLKWWKQGLVNRPINPLKIKSHHFLAALNALHELDPSDRLYVAEKSSAAFSCASVMIVMGKILRYLYQAFMAPVGFVMPNGEFPFPREAWGPMEILLYQFFLDDKLKYEDFVGMSPQANPILQFSEELEQSAQSLEAAPNALEVRPVHHPDTHQQSSHHLQTSTPQPVPEANAYYKIQNVEFATFLGISNPDSTNGREVVVRPLKDHDMTQQWMFKDGSDSSWVVENRAKSGGKNLYIPASTSTPIRPFWTSLVALRPRLAVTAVGNSVGVFHLDLSTNKYLAVDGTNTHKLKLQSTADDDASRWRLLPVFPTIESGSYLLRALNGRALIINPSHDLLAGPTNKLQQSLLQQHQWKIEMKANGNCTIYNVKYRRYLSAEKHSKLYEAEAKESSYEWTLKKIGELGYSIVMNTKQTGDGHALRSTPKEDEILALTVWNDVEIKLRAYNGSHGQIWFFEKEI